MYVDYSKQSPAILPTCVGMRGLERGLERAFNKLGWIAPKPIAYVEIEAFACWNLVAQMEQGVLAPTPVWTDLKTFDWRLVCGKVDFITAGYPCQPFSLAGKQLGAEDPRHLWPYYENGLEAVRPVGCFFENVRQHLNNGYREVRESLEGLGYEVREGIFSAEEVGAPHKRDRLFILAIRRDVVLAHSTISGEKRLSECEQGQERNFEGDSTHIERSGEVLGDAESLCKRKQNNETFSESWSDSRRDSFRTGTPLGDGIRERLEIREEQQARGQFSSIERTGFPMGQGHHQYVWEEPRLKSRMGLTVNGHDFTEDLLRMAGNGVVEQTAELAFLELLNEHKKLII